MHQSKSLSAIAREHGGLHSFTVTLSEEGDPTRMTDCDCWRLLTPLLPGERLPSHVCSATMQETTRDWATRSFELLVPAIPESLRWHDEHGQVHAVDLVPIPDEGDIPAWPVKVDDGYVGLVVQQWAEEAPNATLANQLMGLSAWQRCLRAFRSRCLEPGVRSAFRTDDDFSDVPISVTNRPLWTCLAIARLLRTARLPHTPSTVEHFFATIAGQREPLPTRGLLVTTIVYMNPRRDEGETLFKVDPVPRLELTGDLEFATQDLFDQARQVARDHRDWVHRVFRGGRGHVLNDVPAKRRAQPGAFQAQGPRSSAGDPLDYKTEALAGVEELVDTCRRPSYHDRDHHITQYLDKVYRRVHTRRTRAGIPGQGASGWRKEVRPQLHAILAERLD